MTTRFETDLREPVGVPLAGEVSLGIQPDAARVLRLDLFEDGGADRLEVARDRADRDPGAEPRPGEVQELIDHPTHALGARLDPGERPLRGVVGGPLPGDLGGGEDRRKRSSEIVPEGADEELPGAVAVLLGPALVGHVEEEDADPLVRRERAGGEAGAAQRVLRVVLDADAIFHRALQVRER